MAASDNKGKGYSIKDVFLGTECSAAARKHNLFGCSSVIDPLAATSFSCSNTTYYHWYQQARQVFLILAFLFGDWVLCCKLKR
jgi:hypothetical protein